MLNWQPPTSTTHRNQTDLCHLRSGFAAEDVFEDGVWGMIVGKRLDRRVRESVLQGVFENKIATQSAATTMMTPTYLGPNINVSQMPPSYFSTHLPWDDAENLSLLRVCVFLLGVHFGCDEVAVPYYCTENRETEDDQEQRDDWSAICLY